MVRECNNMIYMDNAATTPLHPAVREVMLPYLDRQFANPSGSYQPAKRVRRDIDNARALIASTIGARPDEIYFTSGGTEGDNWALKAAAFERHRGRIISTNVEHKAVLNCLEWLEAKRYSKTLVHAAHDGRISADDVKAALTNDTFMVSVMTANNEIGTIMPVRDIAIKNELRSRGIILHTDAVQAYGHIALNVNNLGVDMLSASAHKFRGPKGIGFIYIRRDVIETSLIHGGSQEMGMRAGTENTASIIGMAMAAKIAAETLRERSRRETQLRNYMADKICHTFTNARVNGTMKDRLSNNVSICFGSSDTGMNGHTIVSRLDTLGICASAGSACSSASSHPSHVLTGIGMSETEARNSVRFTLSDETTVQDIDYVVACLEKILLQHLF